MRVLEQRLNSLNSTTQENTYCMEPSIEVHHLTEYACQLYGDLIPVDVVVRQVLQVVHSPTLDKFHDEDPLVGGKYSR